MTGDLWALAAAMLLATLQLTLSSVLTLRQLGGAWVAGPRDEPREATGVSGRFVRAYRNLLGRRTVPGACSSCRWIPVGNWGLGVRHRPAPLCSRLRLRASRCTANLLARRTDGNFYDFGRLVRLNASDNYASLNRTSAHGRFC